MSAPRLNTPETPRSLLERAATRLEELATAATAPVWSAEDLANAGHPGVWWVQAETEDSFSCVAELETVNPRADAEWIAALSPAVAAPLAAMLRWDARRLSWASACGDVDKSYQGFELARLILNEPDAGKEPS